MVDELVSRISDAPYMRRFVDRSLGVEGFLAADLVDGALSFGGVRVAPSVDAETVSRLARCMTWKFAGHGIPLSGAKAGIRCRAQDATRPEVIALGEKHFGDLLRTQVIVGRDLGATNEFIDRCYAAVGIDQLHLVPNPECPARIRDLRGYRQHMTGLGVAWATDAALEFLGGSAQGARVLVQGSGRVGMGSALRLEQLGASVIGISDIGGALYSATGLPLAELIEATDQFGSIDRDRCDFRHHRLDRDAMLGLDADVVVLAADSHLVTVELARTIRVPVVVEGANLAVVPGAEELLHSRTIRVIPDAIASSSSAALVGHQTARGNRYDPDALWSDIERSIRKATRAAFESAEGTDKTIREAFYDRLRAGV